MKKLCVLLCIAVLLSLSACGMGGEPTPTTTEPTTVAPILGTTEMFAYEGLRLEITNVAKAEQRKFVADDGEPHENTVYTLYPGAQMRVISAEMNDGSDHEDGLPYAKWFVSAKRGGEDVPIESGMSPLTITPDMYGVFGGWLFCVLAFEWYAPSSPESEQIRAEIFEPAFELYSRFGSDSLQTDINDEYGQIGMEYYRVADPRFPTMAALEAALRELFSEELTQEIMRKTPYDHPIYIEREGKLYSRLGGRSQDKEVIFISIESESENKIVYRVAVRDWMLSEEEFLYTRELIDGKWVFTEFPMEWWQECD
ncbi:MAG: hypothetical protein FWE98_06575 [Oscillospiraceae bacterium]|nr:hypothetical protein [Oscillospiraceae bacterium]